MDNNGFKQFENEMAAKIDAFNSAPEADFDGLSRKEMTDIIHYPFESKRVQLCKTLHNKDLKKCPIFNIVLSLLHMIKEHDGMQLTQKGNLQRKVMQALYSKKHYPDKLIETGLSSLRQEIEWLILHNIKIVLKISGIIRQYKGKLVLVKSWETKLDEQNYTAIFIRFFSGFTTEFNWAYNDGYENEETGQVGFLYMLHLLNKYAVEYKPLDFFVEKYFTAFPTLDWHGFQYDDTTMSAGRKALIIRFFFRFAEWFGLVEIQGDKYKYLLDAPIEVKKTKLLSKLLH